MAADDFYENPEEKPKKLYRSRHDRMLTGVCGGFAEYFSVDPLIIRLVWILISLFYGAGIILYIFAAIIMPENPEHVVEVKGEKPKKSNDSTLFWGGLFILIGILLLFRQMGFFHNFHFWHIPWQIIWAVFLILIGGFLLYNSNQEDKAEKDTIPEGSEENKPRQVYRSRDNKMIAGVCAGLAEYFNIDVTIVRLAYVLLTLASIGIGIIAYFVMVLVFPEKPTLE